MKIKKYISLFFSVLVVVILSCQQESKLPLPFDTLNNLNGAFLRVLSVPSNYFNYYNLDTSTFKINVEESDGANGTLFSSVDLFVSYKSVSGTKVAEQRLKSFPASGFTKSAVTGLPRATLIATFTETIAKLGITKASIQQVDNFAFRFAVNLKDGRVFSSTNSSGNMLTGPFYSSTFQNNIGVGCPSTLEGTYNVTQTGTDQVLGNTYTINGTVTLKHTSAGSITYNADDISGGVFNQIYFPVPSYGAPQYVPYVITDICGNIAIPKGSDGWGDILSGSATVTQGTDGVVIGGIASPLIIKGNWITNSGDDWTFTWTHQ